MYDISNSTPITSILHKHHSFPTTRPRNHGLRMSTRINSTPSINQLLERLSRINPNKRRGPTRRTENLSVLFCPLDDEASWVVGHLIERLVDDGPSSDVWGKMGETRVAGKIFVHEETEQEEDDKFGDTDRLVHIVRPMFKGRRTDI